jgi:hypothetical protein
MMPYVYVKIDAAERLTPTERALRVYRAFEAGKELTTEDVAHMTGLSHHGAWYLLGRLARICPLTFADGKWRLIQRA